MSKTIISDFWTQSAVTRTAVVSPWDKSLLSTPKMTSPLGIQIPFPFMQMRAQDRLPLPAAKPTLPDKTGILFEKTIIDNKMEEAMISRNGRRKNP